MAESATGGRRKRQRLNSATGALSNFSASQPSSDAFPGVHVEAPGPMQLTKKTTTIEKTTTATGTTETTTIVEVYATQAGLPIQGSRDLRSVASPPARKKPPTESQRQPTLSQPKRKLPKGRTSTPRSPKARRPAVKLETALPMVSLPSSTPPMTPVVKSEQDIVDLTLMESPSPRFKQLVATSAAACRTRKIHKPNFIHSIREMVDLRSPEPSPLPAIDPRSTPATVVPKMTTSTNTKFAKKAPAKTTPAKTIPRTPAPMKSARSRSRLATLDLSSPEPSSWEPSSPSEASLWEPSSPEPSTPEPPGEQVPAPAACLNEIQNGLPLALSSGRPTREPATASPRATTTESSTELLTKSSRAAPSGLTLDTAASTTNAPASVLPFRLPPNCEGPHPDPANWEPPLWKLPHPASTRVRTESSQRLLSQRPQAWWYVSKSDFDSVSKSRQQKLSSTVRIMETGLGVQLYSRDRCRRCALKGYECWVYSDFAARYLKWPGIHCARCRFGKHWRDAGTNRTCNARQPDRDGWPDPKTVPLY